MLTVTRQGVSSTDNSDSCIPMTHVCHVTVTLTVCRLSVSRLSRLDSDSVDSRLRLLPTPCSRAEASRAPPAMWFVAFACAAAAAESSGVPTPKTIAVRLRANWRATPLLLEASEFFGGEDLFWRFVEHSAIDGAIALDTDEAQHAAIERAAHDLLAPLDQRLLQTYLATSALSPRVEAQLADERARAAALSIPADAAWWAWACGRAYVPSSAETLEQFVGGLTCAAELAEDDEAHVYTPAASAGAAAGAGDLAEARGPLVTLFATPGGAPFARAHAALRGMAEAGRITYAHVHRLSPGANSSGSAGVGLEEDAPLSGYGVSLAIKNMEYKVSAHPHG